MTDTGREQRLAHRIEELYANDLQFQPRRRYRK